MTWARPRRRHVSLLLPAKDAPQRQDLWRRAVLPRCHSPVTPLWCYFLFHLFVVSLLLFRGGSRGFPPPPCLLKLPSLAPVWLCGTPNAEPKSFTVSLAFLVVRFKMLHKLMGQQNLFLIQITERINKRVATQTPLPTLNFYNPLYHNDIHVANRWECMQVF